ERAVAAAVLYCRTRFQPVSTNRIERELENEFGRLLEESGPPERRPQCKAPFRIAEARLCLTHLDDADRGVEALQRHREADVGSGHPLSECPRDESLESLDRRRRRRDESRNFLGCQQCEERWRIRCAELPENHLVSSEDRQPLPPIRRHDRG